MNEIIEYNPNFTTPPAWLGYNRGEFARGRLCINICGDCAGVKESEAEAKRLHCMTFRMLCARHTAERIAKLTGETL